MLLKVATCLAVLLALFIYHKGRVIWYQVLTRPDLPDAYYVGGNWTSHCSLIQDPASKDVNSCEDIIFWDHHDAHGALTDRRVLLGCDPNRKAWNTVLGPLRDPNPRGHLFLYDPSTDEVQRLVLAGYPDGHDFHPLGMDITPSLNGAPSTLFVVNHARAHTTIEQFLLTLKQEEEEGTRAKGSRAIASAQYVRTLRSPYFVSPNAIALTSPTSFFVSNDHLFTRRLPYPIGSVLPYMETMASLPLSWVAHVSLHEPESESGEVELEHTFAALGIPFANGIAISPSGTQLAVSACSLGFVYFYDILGGDVDVSAKLTTGVPTLSFSHRVPVPFSPDNLAYDDDGALIAAGHSYFPSLIDVVANVTGAAAPSWAVSITPLSSEKKNENDEGKDSTRMYDRRAPLSASRFAPAVSTDEVETLFQSDGSVYGSSATTLRDSRTGVIYVAGLYDPGILMCGPRGNSNKRAIVV